MTAGNEKKSSKRLPKSVYYRRRIIALFLVVLVIGGIALGVRYAFSFGAALMESTKVAKTTKAKELPAKEPGPCGINDLDLVITKLNSASVSVGQEVPITVELKKIKEDNACFIDATQKLIGISIATGETIAWDSSSCAESEKKVPLLLGKKMSYSTEIVWDGKIYEKCKPTKVAQPGTYVITATLDGKKTKSVASLVILPAPASSKE